MTTLLRALGLSVAALITMGNTGNWTTSVDVTPRAHTVGNPDAETTLKEFVSYTCPHCATFAIEGEAPLQLAYIGSGRLKLEMHSIIRNVVDLTATLMIQCGAPEKYLQNHTLFMLKQPEWLAVAQQSTAAQQALWTGPDRQRARQSMAKAFGFYDIMKTRGYDRPQLDRCLSDQTRADALVANTQADYADYGIRGTPSFVLDGELLDNVHNWSALETALTAYGRD
ncbi:MAG: thioredoxin domain-containing protein [Pontixanthobacter sp.]